MWGVIGGLLLFILLISPFISGLAHNKYSSWVDDRIFSWFVKIGDWEWKQLKMSVTNCELQNTTSGGA